MRINSNYDLTPISVKQPNFKRNWQEHVSWGARFVKETGKTNFKLFTFPDAKRVFVEIANKAGKNFGNIKERIVQILAAQGAALSITSIFTKDEESKIVQMDNMGNGIFEAKNIEAEESAQYRYIIVNNDNKINIVKDPYAKVQPDINGWSEIYNSENYEWKATDWLEGKDPRRIVRKPQEELRGLEKLIIEEINIPTISEEGTFEKAKAHIDRVAEKGIATAIEIMPVENTFSQQWGYDGVDKFAINEKMGTAVQLKELIDHAHLKGLNVIMDMVPNHMGPDGDYLTQTGPYEAGPGEFGAKLNYEGNHNKNVRDWMANAALWWAGEFKVDGIRFDMTKETASDYFLKQLVEEVNEHFPQVFTIAEDGRENKESVTRYEPQHNGHDATLDFIDMNIDFINTRNWKTTPHAIGFDSEWDFPYMHELKTAVTHNNPSIDGIDKLIRNSKYRVKYVMSHDEIGNMDGTRLIQKIVAQYLNIFGNISGGGHAERGQRAAQFSQKLVETIVSNDEIPENEFYQMQKDAGIQSPYTKKAVRNAVLHALAKQRVAQGTVMTTPGPKMFFQGDDEAELAHFKFFRELSDEKEQRRLHPEKEAEVISKKGYDTIIDKALPDSKIGRIKPKGSFAEMQNNMTRFNQDLRRLIEEHPALRDGEITSTYKDHGNLVHIHRLQKDDEKLIVFKNFADTFYRGNYSTLGFPKHGKWVEIFNSDKQEYGGWGLTNGEREISDQDQKMNLAANSIVILKQVSE